MNGALRSRPACAGPARLVQCRLVKGKRIGRKLWWLGRLFLISVVVTYLGSLVVFSFFQRKILFPRHLAAPLVTAGQGVEGLERWWLDTPEGRVEAWWIPAAGASPEDPRPAVIFCHGNAELIDYWPEELSGYRRLGIGLLLPEYRGYGRSAGSPSQEAITADLVAFHDRLAALPEVDAKRIVHHGRSIGGGAACALSAERKPKALILQSTFTSIRSMAARYLVPGFLVKDPLDNLAVVRGYTGPVLIIHGRQDDLIPFAHAEELAAAAKDGKLIEYACDHNTCPPDPDRYWRDLEAFLKRAGILAAAGEEP